MQPESTRARARVSATVVQLLHAEIVNTMVARHIARGGGEASITGVSTGSFSLGGSFGSAPVEEHTEAAAHADAVAAVSNARPEVLYRTVLSMGQLTGTRLAERILQSQPLSSYSARGAAQFIASDLWRELFLKKADGLKGNADDTPTAFTVVDTSFAPLRSTNFRPGAPSASATVEHAPGAGASSVQQGGQGGGGGTAPAAAGATGPGPRDFVVFYAGVIQGALDVLGFPRRSVAFEVKGQSTVQFKFSLRM